MPWVRLDDGYPEHPKVDRVGYAAAWLNVCAWAYCARNLTDGFVPNERVERLSTVPQPRKQAALLVEANLWEPGEGGYWIHDYLKYNPSREQVLIERGRNADRVSKHRNATSNGVTPPGRNGVTPPGRNGPTNGGGNGITAPISNGGCTDAPYPSHPGPLPIPIPDTPSVANATSPPGGERRRRTEVDDDFRSQLENEFWEAFGDRGAVQDVMDEAMSHSARAKRSDQRAYLRNWVRRDAEAASRRRNGSGKTGGVAARGHTCTGYCIHLCSDASCSVAHRGKRHADVA